MPKVSIVIPAYNPRFFEKSLQSALTQNFSDFEVVISDDRQDGLIEEIVTRYLGPNVLYVRNPTPRVPGTNRDNALRHASGEYIKFLFDDDVLTVQSLTTLVEALDITKGAFAFHPMLHIDEQDRPIEIWPPEGARGIKHLDVDTFIRHIALRRLNIVGGPTAIMIRMDHLLSIDRPFEIDGRPLAFLSDVALYTNFLKSGALMVGVSSIGAGYRIHGGQTSDSASPLHVAGIVEWELILRHLRRGGILRDDEFFWSMIGQILHYGVYLNQFPALQEFQSLNTPFDPSKAQDDLFEVLIDHLYDSIEDELQRPILAHRKGMTSASECAAQPAPA